MRLRQATEGLFFAMRADGYSQATIELYQYVLDRLAHFLGDPDVEEIKPNDLTRYFAYLRTDYKPRRSSGDDAPLSGSTLQNHWKGIRTFFRWAAEELELSRPDTKLKLPPNNPKAILPLSEENIKALIDAAEYTRQAATRQRKAFRMRRATAKRDLALITLLLDTGMRAGELGRLDVGDLDLETGEVYIKPFGNSQRKTKSRVIPIGKATRRAVWKYLTTRPDAANGAPLFISKTGRRLNANTIRHVLIDLGEKAGVDNCHPHRLRHTFAVEYLRNGGDVFSLQAILGHTSLEMVKNYARLAAIDLKNAHNRASPADNWKL